MRPRCGPSWRVRGNRGRVRSGSPSVQRPTMADGSRPPRVRSTVPARQRRTRHVLCLPGSGATSLGPRWCSARPGGMRCCCPICTKRAKVGEGADRPIGRFEPRSVTLGTRPTRRVVGGSGPSHNRSVSGRSTPSEPGSGRRYPLPAPARSFRSRAPRADRPGQRRRRSLAWLRWSSAASPSRSSIRSRGG